MLEIKIDKAQLERIAQALNPKELQRATRNATDTATTAIRKMAIDTAFDKFNINLKARLRKDPKGRDTSWVERTTQVKPMAKIIFRGGTNPKSGDRPGLHHFAVGSQSGTPTYKIKRSSGVKTVPNAFYGKGKLKGLGIFERSKTEKISFTTRGGKAGMRPKLVRRTGFSTKQMIEDRETLAKVKTEGQIILLAKLKEQVEKQLRKRRG